MNDAQKIKPLTRVSTKIQAVMEDSERQSTPSNIDFDFIYGIATEGLTAFEVALCEKAPGDRVNIQISPSQMRAFFEHLLSPLTEAFKAEPPPHLNIQIVSVTPVTDRELVRALAEKNEGGGCGGDCGCGCG